MGNKVDISEVIELSKDLETASEEIKSSLTSVKGSIDQLTALSTFSGKTATEAKGYFQDLHQTILTSFDGLFTDLQDALNRHINSFGSRVDGSESALIKSDYLKDTEEDITDVFEKLDAEQKSVREIINSVSDISSASAPSTYSARYAKNDAVDTLTELDEDLDSFSSTGKQISEIEDLLNHIKATINNAGAVAGSGRFTDYTGNSMTVGLPMLKAYNAEKRAEVIDKAERSKDAVIKDMDKPLQDVLNKAYSDLKNGEIDENQYYEYLAETKKIHNEEKGEVSENFLKYLADNFDGVEATLIGNLATGKVDYQTGVKVDNLKKNAEKLLEINGGKPGNSYNYKMNEINKVNNFGKALNGPLTVLSIGYGTMLDYKYSDKTVGEAVTKNTASTGAGLLAGWGTSTAITGLGGAFLSATPVGWATLGSVAVGTLGTMTFNWAYDNNFFGIQDGLDWAGKQIDRGWDTITNWAGDAGEALHDSFNLINPFSW
ncbi:T7SS effector LXG polymorphic toxin [Oceanobacillus caeni]|uniref:T7SS effector LXG polymorphic toxin n=1 Tax=Oceanobacillus caeni TaxID=405946 RepID=UPI00195BB9AE